MSNAANPGHIKNAERKEKESHRKEIEDVRLILSTVSGRRFFWKYLTECGIFKSSFAATEEMFFREGQRNIGLKLMADMNLADPKAYMLMLSENKKETA